MKSFKDYHNINEGINDPAIFKAVFMAGGPGSGKSFIAGKTALTALGLKLINSDDIFEYTLSKAGLKTTPEDIFSEKGQSIRGSAKALTAKKQEIALNGRLGLIIDGTGKDYEKIRKQKVALNYLGYDTMMLFVNTDVETALKRNRMRSRRLPDEQVKKMWNGVQNNIGKFQSLFKNDLLIIDNSEGIDLNKSSVRGYRFVSKWVKKDHQNKIAKQWIEKEKKQRGVKTVKPHKN